MGRGFAISALLFVGLSGCIGAPQVDDSSGGTSKSLEEMNLKLSDFPGDFVPYGNIELHTRDKEEIKKGLEHFNVSLSEENIDKVRVMDRVTFTSSGGDELQGFAIGSVLLEFENPEETFVNSRFSELKTMPVAQPLPSAEGPEFLDYSFGDKSIIWRHVLPAYDEENIPKKVIYYVHFIKSNKFASLMLMGFVPTEDDEKTAESEFVKYIKIVESRIQ